MIGEVPARMLRCEGITAAGYVNGIPYCKQHVQKELALAMKPTSRKV